MLALNASAMSVAICTGSDFYAHGRHSRERCKMRGPLPKPGVTEKVENL